MQAESIAECSLGAFCNTFDLHYAIISLDKTNNFFVFCWDRFYCIHLSLMGIQFQKLKKIQTDRPMPVKQGRVRGNKNIFKVGLIIHHHIWNL